MLNPCILGCGGTVQPVIRMLSNRDIQISRWVGVCQSCGHAQITPLYDSSVQTALNTRWHEHFVQGNPEQNSNKLATMRARIEKHGVAGTAMLDVGAGEGWAAGSAAALGMNYFAVEPICELHASMRERGAADVFQSLDDATGSYHIILLRQVLEHMLDPVATLRRLVHLLAPDGVIYVTVPNFRLTTGRKGFRTSSLRPIHVSYFTRDKLNFVLGRVGLSSVETGDGNELWSIARRRAGAEFSFSNEADINRAHLRHYAWVSDNLYKDGKNILRWIVHALRGSRGRHDDTVAADS